MQTKHGVEIQIIKGAVPGVEYDHLKFIFISNELEHGWRIYYPNHTGAQE